MRCAFVFARSRRHLTRACVRRRNSDCRKSNPDVLVMQSTQDWAKTVIFPGRLCIHPSFRRHYFKIFLCLFQRKQPPNLRVCDQLHMPLSTAKLIGLNCRCIEEMSNYLAQNRLAFGLDRSVAVVTWAAKARFRVLPCPVICPGGAEVVRRMAPHEPQRIPLPSLKPSPP